MLKPLGNNVVIKKISDVEKNKYGIILTPSAEEKERNDIGEIIAISKAIDSNDIKVGDKVIYCKYAGSSYKDKYDTCLIIDISDILAVKN